MRSRGGVRGKFILIIITTSFLFCVVPAAAAHVVPGQVVISEVCVRGAGSAVDEFVELYNPTDLEVSLSGWKLQYKPATDGTWRSKAGEGLPADKKIESHKFFLLAGNSYAGDTIPDYRHNANWYLSDTAGHVRIINAEGKEIDRVGYGKSADSPEGNPAPKPPEGESVERKYLVKGYAPCQDTNNNSEDFDIKTPTPQNSSFSTDPLPPPPSHVVISEVYPDAVNDSGSEWIELYNPINSAINISGWTIYAGEKISCTKYVTIPQDTSIPSHCFFLITDAAWDDKKDNVSWPASDLKDNMALSNSNGWVQLNNSGVIIDTVGWKSSPLHCETAPVDKPNQNESIKRKSLYEGYAPCQDTNNNSEDFLIQDTPTPKNSSVTKSPAPPPVPNSNPAFAVPEFNAI